MPEIFLGKNVLTGRRISAPISRFTGTHTHILGGTGMGKSKLCERIARDVITAGYGLIVLDGKGDLYDNLLSFCAAVEFPPYRLHLINPRDRFAPGVNVLERLGGVDDITQANIVIDALQKMHGDTETRHWLKKYGRVTFSPLSLAGFSIVEAFAFTRTDDPTFRRAVLAAIQKPQLSASWSEFEDFRKDQQAERVDVVKTRIDPIRLTPFLCAVLGQLKTTIDWKAVMDDSHVVLCQLAQGADPDALSFIGTALIHQIKAIAYERAQGRRRPCFVLIDEFQNFLTPDIADALATLRGFGAHFILAHQDLEQLKQDYPLIYSAVKSNARNRMIFAGSHEDAETMYLELFSDRIYASMQEVKDEIWQTKALPIDTWFDLYGESDQDGVTILPSDDDEERKSATRTHTGTHSSVPGTLHDIIRELSGRTYYSEAEIKARFISWIHNQDQRHYQLKLDRLPTIPMVSPFVGDLPVSPYRLEELKAAVYALGSRPIAEVVEEVTHRVERFLAEQKPIEASSVSYAHNTDDVITGRIKKKKKDPAV